jgi:hypothetical protein
MDAAYYLFALPLVLAPFIWEGDDDEGDYEAPVTNPAFYGTPQDLPVEDEEDYGALATRPVFYSTPVDEADDDDEAPATPPVLHATPVAEAVVQHRPKGLYCTRRKVFFSPRMTIYFFDKDVPATVKPRKLECFRP